MSQAVDNAAAELPDAESAFEMNDLEAIRAEVVRICKGEGKTYAKVGLEAGLGESTVSEFLARRYRGRNDNVAGKLTVWLESRQAAKAARSVVPRSPAWVETPTAKRIWQALTYAQTMPEIAIAATPPGFGKTATAKHYQRTRSNVWLVTMQPITGGVSNMLGAICQTMGIEERSATRFAQAIHARVAGTDGLLIVDEAQHLKAEAIDQLRSFHDISGIGLALLGNPNVYGRFEGASAREQMAQISSRLGKRVTVTRVAPRDVCMLLDAWNLESEQERRFLKAIATKPGALRSVDKVLRLASLLADGDEEPRGIKHIKAAWEDYTAQPQSAE